MLFFKHWNTDFHLFSVISREIVQNMNEASNICYHADRLPCYIYQFSFKMCVTFFIDTNCCNQPLLKDLRFNSDFFLAFRFHYYGVLI